MKDLVEKYLTEKKERGYFEDKLRGGKVPIGTWTFIYTADDGNINFIINSAKHRKNLKVVKKKGNRVWLEGDAFSHQSLISGLQRVIPQFSGQVEDAH